MVISRICCQPGCCLSSCGAWLRPKSRTVWTGRPLMRNTQRRSWLPRRGRWYHRWWKWWTWSYRADASFCWRGSMPAFPAIIRRWRPWAGTCWASRAPAPSLKVWRTEVFSSRGARSCANSRIARRGSPCPRARASSPSDASTLSHWSQQCELATPTSPPRHFLFWRQAGVLPVLSVKVEVFSCWGLWVGVSLRRWQFQ